MRGVLSLTASRSLGTTRTAAAAGNRSRMAAAAVPPGQSAGADANNVCRLLKIVRKEVDALRGRLPAYVMSLSEPRYVSAVLMRENDEDDERAGRVSLVRCEDLTDDDERPVSLIAVLHGASGGPYSLPYRFCITLPRTYPDAYPSIRCMSICHHLLLNDNSREPYPILFTEENMPGGAVVGTGAGDEQPRTYTIEGMLKSLYRFLSEPLTMPAAALHADGSARGGEQQQDMLDGYRQQWGRFGEHNAERERVIRKWRSLSKNRALLERGVDRGWLSDELNSVFDLLSSPETSGDKLRDRVSQLVTEHVDGVYSFPLFNREFCDLIIKESEDYVSSGLPQPRPNSMNNYGLVINSIGMEALIDIVQEKILQPIASVLFPTEGSDFSGHHSFLGACSVLFRCLWSAAIAHVCMCLSVTLSPHIETHATVARNFRPFSFACCPQSAVQGGRGFGFRHAYG